MTRTGTSGPVWPVEHWTGPEPDGSEISRGPQGLLVAVQRPSTLKGRSRPPWQRAPHSPRALRATSPPLRMPQATTRSNIVKQYRRNPERGAQEGIEAYKTGPRVSPASTSEGRLTCAAISAYDGSLRYEARTCWPPDIVVDGRAAPKLKVEGILVGWSPRESPGLVSGQSAGTSQSGCAQGERLSCPRGE